VVGNVGILKWFSVLDIVKKPSGCSNNPSGYINALNQRNMSMVDALEIALFSGREASDMIQVLQDTVSDVFISACADGNSALARQLIGKANNFRPGLLGSELIAASSSCNHAILKLLFLNKSKFPIWKSDMRAALQKIATSRNVQCAESFLRLFKEEYPDPIERARLIQSPLLAAATMVNIEVVKTLLASCHGTMPGHFKDTIPNVGMSDCDAPAISQAANLGDFTALKTLIKGAVWTSDFRYLETCVTASLYFPEFQNPHSPEIDSLLKSALGENDLALARHIVEMLLDIHPVAPWGNKDIDLQGSELEAELLHIAGLCVVDMRIAKKLMWRDECGEFLLIGKRKCQECHDKNNYVALYAAVKCGTAPAVALTLGSFGPEQPWYLRSLKEEALSRLGLGSERQRALFLPDDSQSSERAVYDPGPWWRSPISSTSPYQLSPNSWDDSRFPKCAPTMALRVAHELSDL
jgi:hypothetical protein